jgi:hypothetical protein
LSESFVESWLQVKHILLTMPEGGDMTAITLDPQHRMNKVVLDFYLQIS